jgi:hypothetical protein
MPSLLHETAFVTAIGGLAWISSLCDSWVMYLQMERTVSRELKASFISDTALLQDLRFGSLWVAKIHHLVQQFVYDDEIVSYTFLLKLFEIFSEDLDNFVEEKQDFCGIGVAFCESEEVEIVVTNVEVLSLTQQMHTDRNGPCISAYIDTLI